MAKVFFSICIISLLLISVRASSEKNNAFFIFGDSTVDPGNNNYITTTAENQANYIPYGNNGFFHRPTGRFSNGRIIVDFIAEYAKLPLIPPFMEPSSDFINGANFASGGAGVLPETNQGQVIDLPKQLKNFEVVRKTLIDNLGEAKAEETLREAVYFISIGSNDYMGGYLANAKMQEYYNPETYVGMVIGNLTQAIQTLYQKGGRKFAFLSLSPLGCLPILRAANSGSEGDCLEAASKLALAHNNALKQVLVNLEQLLNGFKYCNSDFYHWLEDKINHPSDHGFKEGKSACCGNGPYGGIFSCGGKTNGEEYNLCDNPDDYIWWDSFHPTEKIHQQFAKALWEGPPSSVGPYTLQALFNSKILTIADIVDTPAPII